MLAAGMVVLLLLVVVLVGFYATSGHGDDAAGAFALSLGQEFCEPGRVVLQNLGGSSVDPRGLSVSVGGALGAIEERGPVESGGRLTVQSSALACSEELVFTSASGEVVARLVTHPSFY